MMVKICGITNREDALDAIDAGVTALGFNFYHGSPRCVDPDAARDVMAVVPPSVWKVGVFVNEAPERVAGLAHSLGLDVVQLHGEESPGQYPVGLRIWKAARVHNGFALTQWNGDPAEAVLLDGPASGRSFDWKLARSPRRVIIAGGLDADNVREAVGIARPWGVDACSRLETAPGRKDHARMRRFIAAALESGT